MVHSAASSPSGDEALDGAGGRNPATFAMDPDGGNLRFLPFDSPWNAGGGHPNWHGDGERLVRNVEEEGGIRYCQVNRDGTGRRLLSDTLEGGGHRASSHLGVS